MEQIYENIVNALAKAGGYILLKVNQRPSFYVENNNGENVRITIKSIIWVCEYEEEDGKSVCEVKLMDTNDVIWDMLDYLNEEQLEVIERHIKSKGRMNNNTIQLYDDDENYIGPESEYNEFGYDTRTGLKWGESE